MKRDMDLVRNILLKVECTTNTRGIMDVDEFNDGRHSDEQIYYHLNMMGQADLIVVEYLKHGAVLNVRALTWQGHEFLDAVRNESSWVQAKEKVLKATGGLSFEGLKIALTQLMKHALE